MLLNNIIWCLADLIMNFIRYVAMQQEIVRIGMLAFLPLVMVVAPSYIGEGQAISQMGGMFGSSDAGKQMQQVVANMGFNIGSDSITGNVIGKMVDIMMPNMINGMENSPSIGAQMQISDNMMGKLLK